MEGRRGDVMGRAVRRAADGARHLPVSTRGIPRHMRTYARHARPLTHCAGLTLRSRIGTQGQFQNPCSASAALSS